MPRTANGLPERLIRQLAHGCESTCGAHSQGNTQKEDGATLCFRHGCGASYPVTFAKGIGTVCTTSKPNLPAELPTDVPSQRLILPSGRPRQNSRWPRPQQSQHGHRGNAPEGVWEEQHPAGEEVYQARPKRCAILPYNCAWTPVYPCSPLPPGTPFTLTLCNARRPLAVRRVQQDHDTDSAGLHRHGLHRLLRQAHLHCARACPMIGRSVVGPSYILQPVVCLLVWCCARPLSLTG